MTPKMTATTEMSAMSARFFKLSRVRKLTEGTFVVEGRATTQNADKAILVSVP